MKWDTAKPSEAGTYVVRYRGQHELVAVDRDFEDGDQHYFGLHFRYMSRVAGKKQWWPLAVTNPNYEWLGPI